MFRNHQVKKWFATILPVMLLSYFLYLIYPTRFNPFGYLVFIATTVFNFYRINMNLFARNRAAGYWSKFSCTFVVVSFLLAVFYLAFENILILTLSFIILMIDLLQRKILSSNIIEALLYYLAMCSFALLVIYQHLLWIK